MTTKQLESWTGDFGNQYILRNTHGEDHARHRIFMWSTIFRAFQNRAPRSILEVGSNIGHNIRALNLVSDAEIFAVEPNKNAYQTLVQSNLMPLSNIQHASSFDMNFESNSMDMVFTSGVLIHVHPRDLKKVTDRIVDISKRYVLCIEYFSDREEEVSYRNHSELLFKRDFGTFYLKNYPNLNLVDYGFFWKPVTHLDNETWFLFEKKKIERLS